MGNQEYTVRVKVHRLQHPSGGRLIDRASSQLANKRGFVTARGDSRLRVELRGLLGVLGRLPPPLPSSRKRRGAEPDEGHVRGREAEGRPPDRPPQGEPQATQPTALIQATLAVQRGSLRSDSRFE